MHRVAGGSNPNVYGSTYGENAYLIDGMNTTDPRFGTWTTIFNIDAVQEMGCEVALVLCVLDRHQGGSGPGTQVPEVADRRRDHLQATHRTPSSVRTG